MRTALICRDHMVTLRALSSSFAFLMYSFICRTATGDDDHVSSNDVLEVLKLYECRWRASEVICRRLVFCLYQCERLNLVCQNLRFHYPSFHRKVYVLEFIYDSLTNVFDALHNALLAFIFGIAPSFTHNL
ncbi:hypothetical protein DFH11DRAFT_1625248 [Phellopilus nigrolimitatus]|nr:hypothetical protein DFH11DRAFT_1625248 [Phellopilus nigrolimitatus]